MPEPTAPGGAAPLPRHARTYRLTEAGLVPADADPSAVPDAAVSVPVEPAAPPPAEGDAPAFVADQEQE